MINTTLCYIEKNNKYLMLHRIKKQNDLNQDKWIGIGGKFETRESPEQCVRREVLEETGLIMGKCSYRGIITFVSDKWPTEYMHLFTCNDFSGKIKDCDEGVLEWVEKNVIYNLPLWQGDKIFLKLIENPSTPFFSLRLEYKGDTLISAILNEEVIV
ncbi:MAG: 8-oxo-dGTP diphosphatase [Ruminococcaceae bacterium]|nr:8-oxo-dGTP diphosphatase [Oscillospiraceae bacterium]